VSVLTVWNSLKPDPCSVDSLGSFKSQLKSTLFLVAYDSLAEPSWFATCLRPERSTNYWNYTYFCCVETFLSKLK